MGARQCAPTQSLPGLVFGLTENGVSISLFPTGKILLLAIALECSALFGHKSNG